MTVNYEIKSQLAKLLATEDLVVENRNIATAQFNVETRVLTLPMWKRASESVYDMLVGHEVGHALYTPNEDPPSHIPHQFINVIEDARIEKLMKRRYPGLSKSFFKGYKELAEDDFFCLKDEDVDSMNLADRLNLYYKIGNFEDIPFTEDEQDIVNMVADIETWADTILAAEMLYKKCKQVKKEEQKQQSIPTGQDGGSTESSNVPPSSGGNSDGTEENTEEELDKEQSYGGTNNDIDDEPEVKTDQMFEEGAEELNGNIDSSWDPRYIEVPKIDVDKLIVSNEKIQQEIEEYWKSYSSCPEIFEWVDDEYAKFKKSAQKEVSYLVKEFECKKSADAYSRSSTARTGVLDCSKLHTYKHNEDLFKKVTIVPDGKNHGLIFILDWSGSMSDCIIDTIKQLYNLIWFCNKVNIPYDVYAFTNSYSDSDRHQYVNRWEDLQYQEVRDRVFCITPDFSLMQILTSGGKKKDIERQLLNIWRIVYPNERYVNYSVPPGMGLSGTPLNDAILCLHELIPAFKKNNGVQKVHTIVLTDGEANVLPVFSSYRHDGQEKIGTSNLRPTDFIRNRKTGHTYQMQRTYNGFTDVLLQDLRTVFPDVSFIGIRLCKGGDFRSFIRHYEFISSETEKKIKKDRSYTIKSSGYHSYFAMLTSGLSNDTELNVEDGATKAKIKSAFIKNLKAKALNKKVLSQFMDLVC